jgi:hypothetical protein
MRRVLACAAALAICAAVPSAQAKFGITKTRITLQRVRPPDLALSGRTVAVDAVSEARAVTRSHLGAIRAEVESELRGEGLFELVASPAEADSVVRVIVDELVARVREGVSYEERSVKVGERDEWDDKKKKMVKKDVYERRKEPVTVRRVTGHVAARVEVETPGGRVEGLDVNVPYEEEWKGEYDEGPPEARSEEALERHLIERAAIRASAAVTTSPDPVSALLAVDGPLKDGNRMAEGGQFEAAVDAWSRPLKGDEEAARRHNLGVAHEALAYRLAPHDPRHRASLERAHEHYRQALALDPGEKYFGEPIERLSLSLDYAEAAERMMAALERSRATGGRVRAGLPAGRRPPRAPRQADPTVLRNGSFEASLGPWALSGRGAVSAEPGRGGVLELAGSAGPAEAGQELDARVTVAAALSLDYRVVSGEPPIRVLVEYEDAQGRTRVSTLEVSAGESPGPWSTWQADLLSVRPRPARLRHLRLLVESGTARLDDVSVLAE